MTTGTKRTSLGLGLNENPLPRGKTREPISPGTSNSPEISVKLPKPGGGDSQSQSPSLNAEADRALNNVFGSMKQIRDVSPVDKLWFYADGWDGHRAERLSKTVLRHAQSVWNISKELTPDDLPRVNATPDAYVVFSWSDHYPTKELQLSVIDERKLYCRWVLRGKIGKAKGDCSTTDQLKEIITKYHAFSDTDNDGQQTI